MGSTMAERRCGDVGQPVGDASAHVVPRIKSTADASHPSSPCTLAWIKSDFSFGASIAGTSSE